MLTLRKEVSVTAALLQRILKLAGTDMILVGGQALAFWAAYYRTTAPTIAVTKDVDLLGTRADVSRLAHGLDAQSSFTHKRNLTLLVGQVVKELPDGDYINIDVLYRLYGNITTQQVAARAVLAENAAGQFRVMHPIDVLQTRLENVYGLVDKQNEHGLAQLHLAIEMAQKFIADIASHEAKGIIRARPVALHHLSRIESLALSEAGRKVAKRYGLHVADVIDPTPVQHIKLFTSLKLPQLLKLMSPARRAELEQ